MESLFIQRLIPAPPERVFDAWTNSDELQKWWGPKDVRCLSAEIDLRLGGQYRIANELPDKTVIWITGEFEVIERPHLLIYTWMIESTSPATERVTVQFEKYHQGTMISLKHELIPTAELCDQHQLGWHSCLSELVDYLDQ